MSDRGVSLARRLSLHLIPPLLAIWALGGAITLVAAHQATQRAYDRSMLDDALVLSAHVIRQDEKLALVMSHGDLGTILYDQSEQMFFAIHAADGRLIAGEADLKPVRPPEAAIAFSDAVYRGRELRLVTLRRDALDDALIVVGQTTRSRTALLHRLLWASLLPQALLVALMLWWMRRTIAADLAPVTRLRDWLERRGPGRHDPLPEALRSPAQTREVAQLSSAIDRLLARIEAGAAAQREFAGTVAHELRTPLAGVRAAASYGLAQRDPQRWRAQLEAVLASEARASHMIDQLLALALAEESEAGLNLQPMALDACVRQLLIDWLPRLDQAEVHLDAQGLDERVLLLSDRALIEGILTNLLDNAVRYGRPEEGAHLLFVALRDGPDAAVLSIWDQGPGLPPEELERTARRWTRGRLARETGQGTGLGLAIVRRYAELLGATLTMAQGPGGHGLRVDVVLPHRRVETPPPVAR
ncbi:sensor histidine kinase [Roseateles chitosanitabidus]|uniref:sensor histidine kinase n=1 Tax=Roseateles chitosanitabidus TaxID=65048 RepID=UPI00083009C4|nr:sensor histidine kinase N-terminal domain-containing protein [Roseateles chitosanitabidus]